MRQMGSAGLETELRREVRNTKMREAILASLAVAGTLTLAAMAPNTLSILGRTQKKWSAKNVTAAVFRLKDKGLVRIESGKVRLTEAGERYLDTANLRVSKPKRWDKKWRVVIYDIPQPRHALRNRLRDSLVQIGFVRLQHSVWIFPYDCEELIALLKADYHVGKEVLYMIVDKIENDRSIRARFDL